MDEEYRWRLIAARERIGLSPPLMAQMGQTFQRLTHPANLTPLPPLEANEKVRP